MTGIDERLTGGRTGAGLAPRGIPLSCDAAAVLNAAFSHLPDAMLVLSAIRDGDGRITDERIEVTNAAWRYDALGDATAPDPAGGPLVGQFPAFADLLATHVAVMGSGVPHRAVLPGRLPARERWFDTSVEPFADGVIVIARDVTGAQRAYEDVVANERRLRESAEFQQRFQLAMDHAAVGMAIVAPDGRYLEVNAALCEMLGRDAATLRASCWQDVTHKGDLDGSHHLASEVLRGHSNSYRELKRYVRPDGSMVWGELSTACVRNGDGSVQYFVSQVMDVTERLEAEAELRSSEERYRNLIEELDVIVTVRDLESGQTFISRQVEDVLGFSAADLAEPEAWRSRVLEEDRERAIATWEGNADSDAYELAYRMRRADGSIVWLEERWRSACEPDGRRVRWFAVTADVTERKRVADAVARTDRLEAVSRVSAAAAHDFGNVLVGIGYFAGCLADSLGEDDPRSADVASIGDAVTQGIALTRHLLAFGRDRTQEDPAPLDVGWLLTDLAPILRGVAGSATLRVEASAGGLARISRNALEQALLNLVINARDAMPSGGSITISTSEEAVPTDSGLGVRPGPYISITVADTGTGMPPEVLAQAFEPFFTTKEHGTGIGLASVWGAMRAAGGTARAESAVGEGTSVCLLIPVATA